MAINLHISDAQNESPAALRSAAHFLNCLAADQDGQPSEVKVLTQGVVIAPITQETLPANPGNDRGAPGVSTDSTPPPPPPVANASGDTVLDKNGLPWDARIHSSSKNLNKDDTWRYVRISKEEDKPAFEALKLQVEAELRAAMAGNGQTGAPTSTPSVETGADATQPPAPAGDTPPPPPPLNNAADAPPPPPPLAPEAEDEPEPTGVDFKQVFGRVTGLQKHASGNLLPTEKLTEVLELAGVNPPTMAGLMKNKELAQDVWNAIDALVEGA